MDNNKTIENGKVKIVEPNKGRHIAVAGDINTIVEPSTDLLACKVSIYDRYL